MLFVLLCTSADNAFAGNPDRAGEAGAQHLLINPWARSSGLMGMNSSRVTGIEAMRINVAGLTFVEKTEILVTRTQWLQGSDVGVNAAGFAQALGKDKSSVLGVSVMSVGVGEIDVTTTNNPEGGIGTFKPSILNIGVAYSRAFSNSIRGGVLFRVINERIDDLSANGVAVDLGIQYITGPLDNIRLGISLRNVGTPMRYTGSGLSFRGESPDGDFQQSLNQKAEKFELPSLLNIGASYDFYLDNMKNDKEKEANHRLTATFNFTSNSFGKDQVGGGLEYGFKQLFQLRAGYRWEKGITSVEERTDAHTGFSAGVSAQAPLKKGGAPYLGIDYSYRTSSPFSGTHSVGIRFVL